MRRTALPLTALVVGLAWCAGASARQPAPVEIERPEGQPTLLPADIAVADVRLAPGAQRIAFIATVPGAGAEVFVAPVDQPRAGVSLGEGARGAVEIAWSLAGDRLIVALPGETVASRMLRSVPAPRSPGAPIDLTPPGDRARLILRSPRRPDEALVAVESPPGAPPEAWVVNLTTGVRRLAMPNPGDVGGAAVTGYIADRDLAVRLLTARTPEGAQRLLRPAPFVFGAMPFETLLEWAPDEATRSRAVGFDDAGRVLYALDARRGDAELVAIDADTGDAAPLVSAGAPVTGVIRAPSGACLGVWTSDPAAPFVAIDRAVEPDLQTIRAFAGGAIRIVNQSASGAVWLIAYEQESGRRLWATYDRASRTVRRLF